MSRLPFIAKSEANVLLNTHKKNNPQAGFCRTYKNTF